MNWDQAEGKWNEFKGTVRQKWAKLTDDDLESIAGKKDVLLGKLQQRYGRNKEQAETEVNYWISTIDDSPGSTSRVHKNL